MIEVTALGKTYKGKRGKSVTALQDVSFRCEPGQVFGLLGPNGAGKTTCLRILSTALKATSGSGSVMGHDISSEAEAVRKKIGFLSSNTGLYGRLSAREVLTYFGTLFGLSPEVIAERTETLAETFDMKDFLDRNCDALSTGMRQKVNIARTVIHSPPVMVFDEPTAGLDVLTSRTIVRFIKSCREEGRTVIFSTHIMSEVEKLCDRVGIVHQGKLHFCGTTDELRAGYDQDLDEAFVRLIGEVN
ncbi:MAG: sodium transport system ATP-binding protein [Planctomycetota bacterium]